MRNKLTKNIKCCGYEIKIGLIKFFKGEDDKEKTNDLFLSQKMIREGRHIIEAKCYSTFI